MTSKEKLFAQNWVEQYRRNAFEQHGYTVSYLFEQGAGWHALINSFGWWRTREYTEFTTDSGDSIWCERYRYRLHGLTR